MARSSCMPASPGSPSRLRKISAAATSAAARSVSEAPVRGSSTDAMRARAAACGSPRRAYSSTSRRQAVPISGPGPAFSMHTLSAATAPSSSVMRSQASASFCATRARCGPAGASSSARRSAATGAS